MIKNLQNCKILRYAKIWKALTAILLFSFAGCAFADISSAPSFGSIASHITGSFRDIGKLMFAISFIAGFGFVIAGIFKFKQHKDNPTQIPMGTPLAMVVIGIALIFLPSIIQPAGKSIFPKKVTPGGFRGKGISSLFPST